MNKILLSLLGLMLVFGTLHAQPRDNNGDLRLENLPLGEMIEILQKSGERFEPISLFNYVGQREAEGKIGNYQALNMDLNAVQQLYNARPRSIDLQVPVAAGRTVTVKLTQINALQEGFQALSGDRNRPTALSYTPGVFYRGIVDINGQKTIAAITIFESSIRGVISFDDTNWTLGPYGNSDVTTDYVIYKDSDVQLPAIECSVPDDDHKDHGDDEPEHKSMMPNPANCVNVWFEMDYYLYQDNGNNATTTLNNATSLFNVMAALYQNESINVRLGGTYVWTQDSNPYFSGNNTSDLLGSYWTFVNGGAGIGGNNLGHLLSGNEVIGGGRAYIDVLCTIDNVAVSWVETSFNALPTYSWSTMVLTHEMGHNLGSPHTHWCGWSGGPIDNCGPNGGYPNEDGPCANGPTPANNTGTIMSYCHLTVGIGFASGFGTQPGNLIRSEVTNAACLNTCAYVCPAIDYIPGTIQPFFIFSYDSEASDYIVASGQAIISGSLSISLDAGNYVSLLPGFQTVVTGTAPFEAFIDGCGGLRSADAGNVPAAAPAPARQVANGPVVMGLGQQAAYNVQAIDDVATRSWVISFPVNSESNVSVVIKDLNGMPVYLAMPVTALSIGTHQVSIAKGAVPAGQYQCVVMIDGVAHSATVSLQ